jgi:endogenous inhibitor of DNA gyrase (YacG/DUF329 family)
MMDLGAWASEQYRIPVAEYDDRDDVGEQDLSTDGPALN